jgi:hypothetical protein
MLFDDEETSDNGGIDTDKVANYEKITNYSKENLPFREDSGVKLRDKPSPKNRHEVPYESSAHTHNNQNKESKDFSFAKSRLRGSSSGRKYPPLHATL